MKRLVIYYLFIAVLFYNGTSSAVTFEILSQSYHVDGSVTNIVNGDTVHEGFDITQSMSTGFTFVTTTKSLNGIDNLSISDWLTFTDGGYTASESIFVKASGNGEAFGQPYGSMGSAHAISTIVFRPTSSFLVDFSFYVSQYDARPTSELLIDGVQTQWIQQTPQSGPFTYINNGPAQNLGGLPYIARLLVDPSKTYTIIADMDNSYTSGGVMGNGVATLTATVVPESSSIVFLALGFVSLGFVGKRKVNSLANTMRNRIL